MTKHLIAAALTAGIVWAASSTPAQAQIYVEVETAPREIETYPTTVYEGRPVYYYEGHWYYRHGPRWVYYREEPRPLVEYRARPAYHREYARREHRRDYDRRDRRERRERRDDRRDDRREHHHHEHR